MKINVTWKDILVGKPSKTTECMVALALKRELGISYASVGIREARIKQNGQFLKMRLPKTVQRKIRFWDLHHVVLPFSFEYSALDLDVISRCQQRELRKVPESSTVAPELVGV